VAGAARHAALAAVGKCESAQVGGTIFLGFISRTDFLLCGRRTAKGAVRGHGILLNEKFLVVSFKL